MVPGTNVSRETRQKRVIRKSRVGEGRRLARLAPYSGLLRRLGLRWGQVLGAGTQGMGSLENGVANESLDVGGWAGDLSPRVELGLGRHTLSYRYLIFPRGSADLITDPNLPLWSRLVKA